MPLRYKVDTASFSTMAANLNMSFEALNKFAKASQESNEAWEKHAPALAEAEKYAAGLSDSLYAQSYTLQDLNNRGLAFGNVSAITGRIFSSMARDTKNIADNVYRTTVSFLSLATVTGAIAGLIGVAGGLFGLDDGARALSARRKLSMGLGASYGDYSSFALNFGRFGDAEGALGNVSAGMYDVTNPNYTGLLAGGVNPNKGDPVSQTIALIKRLPALFAGVPEDQIGTRAQALNLPFSTQDIVRYLKAAQTGELDKQLENYGKDAFALDLPPKVLEKWANFVTALDRAGNNIEAILGNKLVTLATPLEDISKGVVHIVDSFMSSQALVDTIKRAGDGFGWLSKEIGTDAFRYQTKHFIDGLIGILPIAKRVLEAAGILIRGGWYLGRYLNDPNFSFNNFLDHTFGVPDANGSNNTISRQEHEAPSIRHGTRAPHRIGTTGTHGNDAIDPSPGSGFWWEHSNHQRHEAPSIRHGTRAPHRIGTTGTHGNDAIDPSPGSGFWWEHSNHDTPAATGEQPDTPGADWSQGIHFGRAGPFSYPTSPNDNLQPDLKAAMQRLHQSYGDFTVTSTTGGRHAPNSQHYLGEAIDVSTNGMSDDDYRRALEDAALSGFHRVGISTTHLHLDMGNPGNQHIMAFPDVGGENGRAGLGVDQWTNYLNTYIDRNRAKKATPATDSVIDPSIRARSQRTSMLDHFPNVARDPKRIVVQNESNTTATINRTAYG